ncbi:PPC domain-containing DNA-binding protein [Frigidibacter oleivorans]|uniref:PPC domain-containing DNA-binding protein n=1 Tax=Frigidibacter oleivorans TaxID=2487129 RepID=UPI000F8D3761|nr:DUF296 domain-containing protein [Frigidibacter oleivorans]
MTPSTDDPLPASPGIFHAVRLIPGADPRQALRDLFRRIAQQQDGLQAMAVVTCVGSLTRAAIRHADRDAATVHEGRFEITSLTGTVDPEHMHLHIALADGEGRAFGGHLMPGSAVYTTAELVVVALPGLSFRRAPCPLSGYDELVVAARQTPPGS